jgi:hypothetical protein
MKIGKKLKKVGKKLGKKAIGKVLKKVVKPATSILGGGPLAQIAKPVLSQFLKQTGVPGASQLGALL